MRLDPITIEKLKSLSTKSVEIYNSHLKSSFFQEARFNWMLDRSGSFLAARTAAEEEIKVLKDFKEAVSAFEGNESVKALLGKSLGTEAGRSVLKADSFVLMIMSKYYQNNLDLNEKTFEEYLKEVDVFLFSDTIVRSCWRLILNFEFTGNEIIFSDSLSIRELTPIELVKGQLTLGGLDNLNYRFAKENYSRFIIEKKISYKKLVVDDGKVFSGGPEPDWNMIKKEFSDVLKALRVFKHSDVRFNNILHSNFKTFYPSGPTKSTLETIPARQSLEYLLIEPEEVEDLLQYHTGLKDNETEFKVPLSRLSYSTDRYELEDRLIDLIIGLESLYKSSGSMHLGLRCALTLEKDKQKAKELYLFIDQMRELRNKIVHGSSLPKKEGDDLSKENVKKLTEILRDSIKLKLDHPEHFPKTSSDWNAKYFI
jgi:hypothetical protein